MGDLFVNQVQRVGTSGPSPTLAIGRAAVLFDPASFTVTDAPGEVVTDGAGASITDATHVTLVATPAIILPAALTWHQPAFSAASPTETVILARAFVGALTINGADVWPRGSVTADDTNYAALSIGYANLDGSGATTLASVTTKTGGSGGTGNWSAGVRVAWPAGPYVVPQGKVAFFKLVQIAAGVNLPAFELVPY